MFFAAFLHFYTLTSIGFVGLSTFVLFFVELHFLNNIRGSFN
jgi:hypothetical protein